MKSKFFVWLLGKNFLLVNFEVRSFSLGRQLATSIPTKPFNPPTPLPALLGIRCLYFGRATRRKLGNQEIKLVSEKWWIPAFRQCGVAEVRQFCNIQLWCCDGFQKCVWFSLPFLRRVCSGPRTLPPKIFPHPIYRLRTNVRNYQREARRKFLLRFGYTENEFFLFIIFKTHDALGSVNFYYLHPFFFFCIFLFAGSLSLVKIIRIDCLCLRLVCGPLISRAPFSSGEFRKGSVSVCVRFWGKIVKK